jgi:Holliday junction resolvase RusA-like endonuclease
VIDFFVPGTPVAWARTRGGKTTKPFTGSAQRAAKQHIGWCAKLATPACIVKRPVELRVHVSYPWPKSWSAKKRSENTWKTSRPDADNHLKLVMDALNGILWHDDAQVCAATVTKRYSETPGLHVKIATL